MIKAVIDSHIHELVVTGTAEEICASLCALIDTIYGYISMSDEETGEQFRRYITTAISDPASPVWKLDPEKVEAEG